MPAHACFQRRLRDAARAARAFDVNSGSATSTDPSSPITHPSCAEGMSVSERRCVRAPQGGRSAPAHRKCGGTRSPARPSRAPRRGGWDAALLRLTGQRRPMPAARPTASPATPRQRQGALGAAACEAAGPPAGSTARRTSIGSRSGRQYPALMVSLPLSSTSTLISAMADGAQTRRGAAARCLPVPARQAASARARHPALRRPNRD